MAFGGFSQNSNSQPVAEINMIPLIDVMLVLLVIFIIAAPLMTHAVNVELPKASSNPEISKPEVVHLSVDATGRVYWNDQAVDAPTWRARMGEAAGQPTQPELRIRADGDVAYRHVAGLMSDAAREGLNKIGFVTEPE
ncbi:MAG: biopolymer transporter ExbD [Hydrogenophilaceae bacterium]|nr:biopolymer transporter ExbD [Hydrogenophilaceae bacterium]